MTEHSELIARLEALTGPDREVDALIKCALLAPAEAYVEQSRFNGEWCVYHGVYGGSPRLFQWPRGFENIRLASLTASIDAAVALCERLLPGWNWVVGKKHGSVWNNGLCISKRAGHAIPAIALLIATLKALDAKEPS